VVPNLNTPWWWRFLPCIIWKRLTRPWRRRRDKRLGIYRK
jgi:hypothetical protein